MSLESAIADLVSASTSLVSAVNVTRTTLENTEATAAAQVQPAAVSATEAANQATAASNSVTAAKASLTTAMADYAAQKTAKGLPAVQSAADSELADRLHRRDPARHPFRGARPSLVMDFVRQECHRNNAAGNLEPVDLNSFMTFTRASTATYVGPDGLIKEAASNVPRYGYDPVTGEALGLLIEEQRTNLVTYSRNLESGPWVRTGYSCETSSDCLAPDGSLSASKLVALTSAWLQCQRQVTVTPNTTYTFSFWINLSLSTRNGGYRVHDISNSVDIGSYLPYVGSAGWVRQTFTFTTASNCTAVAIYPHAYNALAGYKFYFWGIQLEAGAFPTSYIPTPATFTGRASTKTYFDSNGVLQTAASGVAVTDHGYVDGRWVSKGLSLEPQATNLLLQSQDFTGYGVNGTIAPTISRGTVLSPTGVLSCADVTFAAGSGSFNGVFMNGIAGTLGTTYTASVFLKAGIGSVFRMSIEGSVLFGGSSIVDFDQATGNVSVQSTGGAPVTIRVTQFGAWYRISLTRTAVANGSMAICFYSGIDGANRFVIYGAQIETGPVATSYIPTTTAQVTRAADTSTSAQVTRAGDTPTVSNFALGPVSVGTISVTHDRVENIAAGYIFEINTAGLDVSRIVCRTDGATAFKVFNIRTASTDSNVVSSVGSIKSRSTVGMSYAGVSCKTSRDGGGVATLAAIEAYHAHVFTNIKLGWTAGNTSNGYIRQLTYFPRQLSDADLQALTILEN